MSKISKQLARPVGFCMYVDSKGRKCTNRTIASHSIQKGGALKVIAEGSHVYRIENRLVEDKTNFEFKNVGISKASVFPGYCKKHDLEFFSEIENDAFDIDHRNLTLVMARAIARDIFTKSGQLRLNSSEEVKEIFYETIGREDYDTMMAGTVMAKQELNELYEKVVRMVHSDNYKHLVYVCFEFEDILPFCYSGTFTPEHCLDGTHILPEYLEPWNVLSCFCGNIGDKNLLFLGSVLGQDDEKLLNYLNSIKNLKISPSDFSLNFGLEYAENIFFRPSWIDGKNFVLQQSMLQKMHAGLPEKPEHRCEDLLEYQDLVLVKATNTHEKLN